MEYLSITNWDRWQSYRKDRGQPPWIKIHRCVMRNPEWVSLTDAERGQLVAMWLLAADRNGVIPASPDIIHKLCFMGKLPNINKFIELGFVVSNSRHDGVKMASNGCQPDQPEKSREDKSREDKSREDKRASKCPHNEIVKLWNDKMVPQGLPEIKVWGSDRQAHLKARWEEDEKRQNIQMWEKLFDYIVGCDFLMGRVEPRPGYKRFKISLPWIIRSSNQFAQIIEGKYVNEV